MASYLPKVNNGTTKARCRTSPKSAVRTPEQHKWRHYGVSTANQKHITQLAMHHHDQLWACKCQNKSEETLWRTITTYLNETKYKTVKIE